jgi:peptide/nickel transport system substrate-binding protein
LDLGIETVDQAKRKLVYEELQRILVADSPILFLYSPNNIHVGKLSVNGFLTLPTESTVFLKQTWIDR